MKSLLLSRRQPAKIATRAWPTSQPPPIEERPNLSIVSSGTASVVAEINPDRRINSLMRLRTRRAEKYRPTKTINGAVRASQRSAIGLVAYANSITLTPGTVSIEVDDDTIVVHALTEVAERTLQDGEMDRRVAEMEGIA